MRQVGSMHPCWNLGRKSSARAPWISISFTNRCIGRATLECNRIRYSMAQTQFSQHKVSLAQPQTQASTNEAHLSGIHNTTISAKVGPCIFPWHPSRLQNLRATTGLDSFAERNKKIRRSKESC